MPRPRASEVVPRVRIPASEPLPSVCHHNGKVPTDFDVELRVEQLAERIQLGSPNPPSSEVRKTVIDALPGVQYAGGKTYEPGTHETAECVVEVPTATGPTLEALGERRAQLRANLGHARASVKGADDTRAVAAENALRKFDESGDGIRLRLFCVNALKETSYAQP